MNNFNSNYKPYSNPSFGGQQKQNFGQGTSSFGGFNNSYQNFSNNNQSPFRPQNSFGQNTNQFGTITQRPFASNYSTPNYVGFSFQSPMGYSLGAAPYQTRPMGMNRPISVYGNTTGFYFPRTNYVPLGSNYQYQPRQNNSIMFNNATQPPLVSPENNSQNVAIPQEDYSNQYDQNQYDQNQYVDQNVVDNTQQNTTEYADESYANEPNINYGYIKSVLDELSQSSNSENQKAAIVADVNGNVIAQGYNFITEDGTEYQAEDYALQSLGEIQWDPNTSILFTNGPLTEDTANSCVSYGVKTVQVLSSSSKETKKFKKDKGMKLATSVLEDNGVNVEILELE